ncbi:hypothetical protein K504DRAFT_538509 [Pleomassaria siparia CBS 279.74]|uniref:Uncharacterized protein n=1 Tax=Pleomassaria siparia CBS 279.74 TaxID=1314801 RepID=A0A6G1JUQ1_9PLEO|nr:hypothetical protein K504DRAFT_538509 [Pleomassaria siparia CBS 279.74]
MTVTVAVTSSTPILASPSVVGNGPAGDGNAALLEGFVGFVGMTLLINIDGNAAVLEGLVRLVGLVVQPLFIKALTTLPTSAIVVSIRYSSIVSYASHHKTPTPSVSQPVSSSSLRTSEACAESLDLLLSTADLYDTGAHMPNKRAEATPRILMIQSRLCSAVELGWIYFVTTIFLFWVFVGGE